MLLGLLTCIAFLPVALFAQGKGDGVEVRAVSARSSKPSRWYLKVYDYNLPSHHYLESTEADLELQPGEQHAMAVRILPQLRPVIILEQGTIVSRIGN